MIRVIIVQDSPNNPIGDEPDIVMTHAFFRNNEAVVASLVRNAIMQQRDLLVVIRCAAHPSAVSLSLEVEAAADKIWLRDETARCTVVKDRTHRIGTVVMPPASPLTHLPAF